MIIAPLRRVHCVFHHEVWDGRLEEAALERDVPEGRKGRAVEHCGDEVGVRLGSAIIQDGQSVQSIGAEEVHPVIMRVGRRPMPKKCEGDMPY